MCGCRPLVYAHKISLGSWIKPLGFDLCQYGPRDNLPRNRPKEGCLRQQQQVQQNPTIENNKTSKDEPTLAIYLCQK